MKTSINLLLFVCLTSFGIAQNFELNHDLDEDQVSYQGIIESDSVSVSVLLDKSVEWLEEASFKQKLDSEDKEKNEKVYDLIFSVVGKKSELGNAYNYRFSTKLKLEFKDGKVRYTFYKFMKKSSPGEPGSTIEAYIENYKPKISSVRSRERAAIRLDEIELDIHDKVNDVVQDLIKTFQIKQEDDW